MNKPMNTFKRIWNVVSIALIVVMVLCALFLMGSRLFGYECYAVISGSMEPKYGVGDLLYVKTVDVNTIQPGDDITFVLNQKLDIATHQVVRVDAENKRFYTKGLANNIEDGEPVLFENVIGVPQFSIPLLGYVSNYAQNPPGTYVVIAVGAALILLVFLPDMLGKKKEKEETDEETADLQQENAALKEELEKLRKEAADKTAE